MVLYFVGYVGFGVGWLGDIGWMFHDKKLQIVGLFLVV